MNENNFLYSRNFRDDGDIKFPMPDLNSTIRRPPIDWPQTQKKSIGVTPGAVIGAIIGGTLAKNKILKDNDKQTEIDNKIKLQQSPGIDGNYYNQVSAVHKNLQVIFTPVSAIYVVNNKNKPFTLDTIEVDEMNRDMHNAWNNKDGEYFKGLLMSKMFSEMQIAEQGFAKDFIKKQLNIKDAITKDASDTSFLDDITTPDLILYSFKSASLFINNEQQEKLAGAITRDIENESDDEYINLLLERPFDKYAGVISGITDSLGFHSEANNVNTIKKRLENPKYTMKNIKVGFFPDRVIFSLDNQLVSTLPLMAMNEEGYSYFLDKNQKYFKSFFTDNVKEMINKKANISSDSSIEKRAEEIITDNSNSVGNCLLDSNTHPVVIYLLLTTKLGMEWLSFDITIIESILKKEFSIDDIPESTINKVMTILMINQSEKPFINSYAFEKAVLSLASKPVELLESQKDIVKMQDIAFAIDIMDRTTPNDDIYDNFSSEVISYMCDILSSNDMYVYNPTNIIGSPTEPIFNEKLNELLLKSIKGKMTLSSDNSALDEEIYSKCEYVADNSFIVLKSIRRYIVDNQSIDPAYLQDGTLIDMIIEKKGIKPELSNIVKAQIVKNLALDSVLDMYDDSMKKQLVMYGLLK